MSCKCDNCGKMTPEVQTHFVTREEEWCPKCIETDGEYEEE